MSKPLNQIIYTIKEELSGYKITDDTVYDNDYLTAKINGIREVLIAEQFKEGGIDGQFFQTICCLDVSCNTQGCEINGKTYKSGSLYYYVDLPQLVSKVGWKNIMYFGLDDLRTGFARHNFDGYMSSDGALWTGKKPSYTVIGEQAFLKNLPTIGLKKVCMIGLLSDPTDACDFDEETNYPVPDVYKLELLVKKDILSLYSIPGDEIQNSRDMSKVAPDNRAINNIQNQNNE